jgi:hypothetical protein
MRHGSANAFVVLALLALAARPVVADFMAYGGKRDIRTEGATLVVEHHHDWSRKARPSWVKLSDRASRRERWKRDSGPLDVLWLSPDEKYVVGLSQIKLGNDRQLMVAGTDGSFLHEQRVRCDVLRPLEVPCSESTSNWVHWYDGNEPGIDLVMEGGRPVALSFNRTEDLACRFRDASKEMPKRCIDPPRRATLRLER